MENNENERYATIRICQACGISFLFRRGLQEETIGGVLCPPPRICPVCKKKYAEKKREERELFEYKRREEEKNRQQKLFMEKVSLYPAIDLESIKPNEEDTLYILGNGFDMMHKVKSSYYHFRDSMGKKNELREALERILMAEDIWADFEQALGKFNVGMMMGDVFVDTLLELFGAYDEDAGQAELFMAIETAARPITTIAWELPKKFRQWVEGLKIGTDDRPLSKFFCNGKVLCFNYTEFPETLYGVSAERVCYVHGCRKNKGELLILGHMLGASEEAYAFAEGKSPKNVKQRGMVEIAQQFILDLIAECDESLTKNCRDILKAKQEFFQSLGAIKKVVVIGHSMSEVDMPYFQEVVDNIDVKTARWYIGCHGLSDFLHMEEMQRKLRIPQKNISVFRTDIINTTSNTDALLPMYVPSVAVEKECAISPSGNWKVTDASGRMKIYDKQGKVVFEILLVQQIARVVFSEKEEVLLVATKGYHKGIFLFGLDDAGWNFRNEFQNAPNQSLMNPRLRHVYLSEDRITFVYNNRVRIFSLTDGRMIKNFARDYKKNYTYEGEDVQEKLKYR